MDKEPTKDEICEICECNLTSHFLRDGKYYCSPLGDVEFKPKNLLSKDTAIAEFKIYFYSRIDRRFYGNFDEELEQAAIILFEAARQSGLQEKIESSVIFEKGENRGRNSALTEISKLKAKNKELLETFEKLQAFNKSEAGKAFFERQKQEAELIAEFENKAKKAVGYLSPTSTDLEEIKQAARNLWNKQKQRYDKEVDELSELFLLKIKNCRQNTASAVFEDIEKYSVMTKELKEIKKKHLKVEETN